MVSSKLPNHTLHHYSAIIIPLRPFAPFPLNCTCFSYGVSTWNEEIVSWYLNFFSSSCITSLESQIYSSLNENVSVRESLVEFQRKSLIIYNFTKTNIPLWMWVFYLVNSNIPMRWKNHPFFKRRHFRRFWIGQLGCQKGIRSQGKVTQGHVCNWQ